MAKKTVNENFRISKEDQDTFNKNLKKHGLSRGKSSAFKRSLMGLVQPLLDGLEKGDNQKTYETWKEYWLHVGRIQKAKKSS